MYNYLVYKYAQLIVAKKHTIFDAILYGKITFAFIGYCVDEEYYNGKFF
jgi:hypothetical protein